MSFFFHLQNILNQSNLKNDEKDFHVEILDMTGHQINRIAAPMQSNDRVMLKWDLTNQSGAKVPPGIYFGRITMDGYQLMKKIVVVE
jgi:hypothetical protein